MENEESFYPVSSAYSPDHIVYCRPWPLYVKKADDMEQQYDLIERVLKNTLENMDSIQRLFAYRVLDTLHGEQARRMPTFVLMCSLTP